MIAALTDRREGQGVVREAIARALLRYAPDSRVTQLEAGGSTTLFAGPGALAGRFGAVSAVVHGWIDNRDELAAELGCDGADDVTVYAAALERWGGDAERHLIGNYAAAAVLPDGALHVARAPWDAPPLHYHVGDGFTVASPLLRVLFAAGTPRNVDLERVVDELAFDWRSGDETGWYRGTLMVPLGASVGIGESGRKVSRWYGPPQPGSPDDYDEEQAVQQALALLDEAAGKALAWSKKPALSLSGGLDSPLVATSLLAHMPSGEKLPAITFVPDRDWGGECQPGTMGDEAPLVAKFVAAHPQIDWHRASDRVGGMDYKAREVFAASECFAPGLTNVAMVHNVYETARALGCDTLLVADFGNLTFSDGGLSAYAEYARRGEWGQLARLLRAREGDPRSLPRKLAALSLLPHLPAKLRTVLRTMVHPDRRDMVELLTPLSQAARTEQARRAQGRGSGSAWADFTYDLSRDATVRREWIDADGPGKDIDLAFEQIYGFRRRDVTAYRPLVEFCLSLPNRAFAWHGLERRLARKMAERRLPVDLARNRLHGQHNVDWHARQTRDIAAMREVLVVARDHAWLSETLDLDRMERLLDQWPDHPTFVPEIDWPLRLALPRALLAARFIGWLEQRNDL